MFGEGEVQGGVVPWARSYRKSSSADLMLFAL